MISFSCRSAGAAMENMVWVPGGTFLMGSDRHRPKEALSHQATVGGFWRTYTVTAGS
jgi:formylglycine-generating enzyme required for sulfatase activity